MNRKIWLINMIYLCLVLNGCSGSEIPEVNEQDVYMEIMGEQENVEHGESEQEVRIQVIDENAAIENFMLEDYENEILEREEVTASEILGESNEEILETISDLMGLDVVATWEDVDFYLQEDVIVFFYRMPGYWEEVVLGR